MLRPLVFWSYRLLLLAALIVCAVQGYRNRVKFELFQREWNAHANANKLYEESLRREIDGMYRTLYTDPDKVVPVTTPPVPTRTPSSVELWQRNRDKELRDRIGRLEQWRLRLQPQFEER
jgi:hypothetical protein